MKNKINFDKKAKYFLSGLIIVCIFDTAISFSIFIRGIIYFTQGDYLIPLIQILPLIFFLTLAYYEYSFLISFLKLFKTKENEIKNKYMVTFNEIELKNSKKFKKEFIFAYIGCSFIVLFAGLGIIPLVLMIKGDSAYKLWKKEQTDK